MEISIIIETDPCKEYLKVKEIEISKELRKHNIPYKCNIVPNKDSPIYALKYTIPKKYKQQFLQILNKFYPFPF